MNQLIGQTGDDTRFDRLVDGEMSDAERRQLLASLDHEAGGWRRCAMAFLEAQAWQQNMPEVSRDVEAAKLQTALDGPDQPVLDPAPAARPDRGGLVKLVLAMAACFLVAFFLGTEVRQRFSPQPAPAVPLAQQKLPANTKSPDEPSNPSHDESVASSTEPSTQPTARDQSPVPVAIPWGEATLVMDDGEGHEVDVPVFDLDPYARQVLVETSTASLDNLRDEFRRRGFDVRRDVRWPSIEVAPGQRMVVPVGEFEITPVSGRVIQ